MSKIFAVVKNNFVDNMVVADDSSTAQENELWVDVSDYGDFTPYVGARYNPDNINIKFVRNNEYEPNYQLSQRKTKILPLAEGQTLTVGEWLYQGNSSIGKYLDTIVKSYNSETNVLEYMNTISDRDILRPELPLHTANLTLTIDPNGISVANVRDASNNIISTFPVFVETIDVKKELEEKAPKIISKSALRARLTNAEYANILLASKSDVYVQIWLETYNMVGSYDLGHQLMKDDKDMLVAKGLLTQERADIVYNTVVSPNEMP